MNRRRRSVAAALTLAVCSAVLACTVDDMVDQPRHDPLDAADVFADGASSRPAIAGTVPRSGPEALPALVEVDRRLLERGRERYAIHCSPCHGLDGSGDGMVVRRGYPRPPDYASPRLLAMPDHEILDVVARGRGTMPPYGSRLGPHDRVAVTAWVRVLQRSAAPPAQEGTP